MWWWSFVMTLGWLYVATALDPLVATNQGSIKGVRADDGEYSIYLGIPYGKLDENDPFGPALPHPKFGEVFEAVQPIACPQPTVENGPDEGFVYTIDCLRLNIYVPDDASSEGKLPVMVYIHGGDFEYGSANIGAKYLVQHGIVVVSMNYRLGVYGFMCLDTPEVPGNQGLKDQYLALEWIKDNIGAFGGDATKITAMGDGSGSVSIDLHISSKMPKLFNRAILQSGTALAPDEVVPANRTVALQLSAILGLYTENLTEAMEFLAKAQTELVTAASSDLGFYFRACVEGDFVKIDPIVSAHPERIDDSNSDTITILAGYNIQDPISDIDDGELLNIFNNYIKTQFDFGDNSDMEGMVRNFYIGDEDIDSAARRPLGEFVSDFQIIYPITRNLLRYSGHGPRTIYHYVFSYNGNRSYTDLYGDVGARSVELNYLFSFENESPASHDDQIVINRLTTLWTNFVKYGDPTPQTTDLLPVEWSPMTSETVNYLRVATDLEMGRRPFHKRMAFWHLFYKHNEPNLRTNV